MSAPMRTLSLALLVAGAAACRREPPPVLFPTDTAPTPTPDVAPRPAPDAAVRDAGRISRLLSSAVPGDGSVFSLDGVTTRAPAGERFTRYVALDVEGDGDRDAVVSRARADGTIAGVTFLRREPAGFVSVPIEGGQAPSDARCNEVDLHSNSPHSVVVTYGCGGVAAGAEGTAPPSVASEHLVLALETTPSVRLRVSELLPTPQNTLLDTSVDAMDRDGDGRDDVVITLGARRPGEREDLAASATVVLFDRATGFARDTTEPEASFARLASSVRALANRRRAPDAIAAAERVVRLRRALCTESGAARLRIGGQVGVSCAASAGLRATAEALARAYLALGEYPAAAALLRPDSASELGVVTSDRLESELRRAAPAEPGVTARSGPFIGQALDATAFARASALVLTPANEPTSVTLRGPVTAMVDLASLAATPGEPGSLLDVQARAPDGSRTLQGFYQTCDGLVAALCPGDAEECISAPVRAGSLPPQAIAVRITDLPAPDHAARCLQNPQFIEPVLRSVDLRALGFGREGLVIAHRGRLARIAPGAREAISLGPGDRLGGGFAPGSAVSQSGQFAVLTSSQGLFVRDAGGRWRLWSAPPLAGRYRQLTDLTISDDGRTVAALLGGQLWVLQRTESPPDAGTPRRR
jgi:hypothetical protein